MGFMGLSHFHDSDEASDFAHVINEKYLKMLVRELKKETKRQTNEFNTPGWINSVLYLEAFILPSLDDISYYKSFQEGIIPLAKKLGEVLEKVLETCAEDEESAEFITDFKRMKGNVDKILATEEA